jgi:ANTAR domain/GAF domain
VSTGEHTSVDELLEAVVSSPTEAPTIEDTMALLTHAACQNVPSVDYASITIRHSDGRLETVGSTGEMPTASDELQYRYREGPCYEAVTDGMPTVTGDVAVDPRWPRYGPKAAELGVTSQFALEIFDRKDSRGALNLYARERNAFDGEDDLVRLFGVFAATVLGYAREVDQLKSALSTRAEIGRAVGIIMERYGLSQERAFEFLIRISQTGNIKLNRVAHELVEATNRASQAV